MSTSLFRREAIEHQRARLWGEVILSQPTSYFVITFAIALSIGVCLSFVATNNYARKESASGFLKSENDVVRVFAEQSGELESVLVEEGQSIKKGQPLARIRLNKISKTGVDTQYKIALSKERELQNIEQLIANSYRQQTHQGLMIQNKTKAIELEIEEQKQKLLFLEEELSLATQHQRDMENLLDRGFVSKRLYDEKQLALLRNKQTLAEAKRQLLVLNGQLIAEQNNHTSLHFRYIENRNNLNARKEVLHQQLATINQANGYLISSPIDGEINSLLIDEGTHVKSQRPILTISPPESKLYAQLLVPSRAIGLIEPKQTTKIQYDAFPYQRFGIFEGEIIHVSESVFVPNDLDLPISMQESFYLVKVAIEQQAIEVKGQAIPLKSGMLVNADITLENRTILQWLLDPILSVTKR